MDGTLARMGEMSTKLWSENPKGRDRSEDLGVHRKIILEWMWGGKLWDWIHLAPTRDRWRAVVNTVMNLRVP
jgi:hypothetical protein